MKKTRLLAVILVLAMLLQIMPTPFGASAAESDTIVVYPEYPEQLARDNMYRVYISQGGNTYELPVYNSMRHANHYFSTGYDSETDRRFCEFSFGSGEVTVSIVSKVDMTSYAIMPSIDAIASTYSGNTVTFKIDEAGQYVFRLNDDDSTNLAIFVDPLETDLPKASNSWNNRRQIVKIKPGEAPASIQATYDESTGKWTNQYSSTGFFAANTTLYFEAGWHDVSSLELVSGQHVYLAPGAVLNTRIQIPKSNSDIKIYGRGLLRDYNDTRAYNSSGVASADRYNYYQITVGSSWNSNEVVKNVTINDIKLFDSKSFCLVFLGAQDCSVDNIKIIANEISTDGISFWGNSRNISVTDSFFYVADNTFVIGAGGACGNITMDNLVVGSTITIFFPQGPLMGTNNFTNIDIFRCNNAIYEPASGYAQESDTSGIVNISNLSAVDCVAPINSSTGKSTGRFFSTRNTATNYKTHKTINLSNISLVDEPQSYKVTIGMKEADSNGEPTSLTTAANYQVNLKNVYAGSTAITASNVDFDDYNANRVTTNSSGEEVTLPSSAISVTNDGTFTPVTRNRTVVNYNAYETFVTNSERGYQVIPLTEPFEKNSTVYVSLKSYAEAFGFNTYFNEQLKALTIYDENLILRVVDGSDSAAYNDTVVKLDAPAIYNGEEMMVPYTIFEVLGLSASYEAAQKNVVIGNYDRIGNLITNHDFENGRTSLASWTTYNFTPLTITTDAHTGNYAMRYTEAVSFTEVKTSKGAYQNVYDTIRQYGAGVYKISFWAKCDDEDLATINNDGNTANDYMVGAGILPWYGNITSSNHWQKATNDWKYYEQQITIQDIGTGDLPINKANRYYMFVSAKNAKYINYDDIKFERVSSIDGTASVKYTMSASGTLNSTSDATVTVTNAKGKNLTYYAINDYVTVGSTTISGSNEKFTVSVAYPSNYERTTRIVAKDSNGKIAAEIQFTIPATTTDKHVVDFTHNLTVSKEYDVGATVDTQNLALNVVYNNGTTANITSGWTLDADFSTAGEKEVTLTYDNLSYTFPTTVIGDDPDTPTDPDDPTDPDVPTDPEEPTPPNEANLVSLGASIRIASEELSAGLRFGAKFSKNELYDTYYPTTDEMKKYKYDESNNFQFGTIMIPVNLIPEGETVISLFESGNTDILEILGKGIYEEDAESITFTGVLIGIPETFDGYTRTLQTAFYVRVRESEEDEWTYIFSDELEDSYYSVAVKALEKTYNYSNIPNPTEEEKAIMDALEDIVTFVEEGLWIDGKWW